MQSMVVAAAAILCGYLATAQEPRPSLAGASISDQLFDRNTGTLTFTLRNDSARDLVAWVYTITPQYAPGRGGRGSTMSELHDGGTEHAFATTPGLQDTTSRMPDSYLTPGKTLVFVKHLHPPAGSVAASRSKIPREMLPTYATVALSAVVFADGRATGEPGAVARILEARKRQALESRGVVEAFRQARANKNADVSTQLRAAARTLPKPGADLLTDAADQLDRQPNAQSRDRALTALIEAYEVRQKALTRAIVVQ